MNKKESLFRKENPGRLSDPEQLNEYVKVVSTPIWLILIGVIVILAGAVIFASAATLEKKVPALIEVTDEGSSVLYSSAELDAVSPGLIVRADNSSAEYKIVDTDNTMISKWRYLTTDQYDDVIPTDWLVRAQISDTGLANGIYRGYIVTGTYHPISYLIH